MSSVEDTSGLAIGRETTGLKLEAVVIPVSDVDRAKEFYDRLGWRLDADVNATSLASVSDLSRALRRAEAAHGEHEARTGVADPDWPVWYATYMVREQAGEELPS